MHSINLGRKLFSPVQTIASVQALADGASHNLFTKDKTSKATSGNRHPALMARRRPDHYRIELKGWIPQSRIVDPDVLLRPKAYLRRAATILDKVVSFVIDHLPFGLKVSVEYKYISVYRGDNHRQYNGSFRAQATVAFTFDGRRIRKLRRSEHYGTTHRDWSTSARIQLSLHTPAGDKNIKTITKHKEGVQRGKIDRYAWASTDGRKTFNLGIRTRNPLLMSASKLIAPFIDAYLVGVFRSRKVLVIGFVTNKFPSWGFRIIKNGKTVHVHQLYDASKANTRGISGAVNLTARMIEKHKGSIKIRFA
jgi:hypothetical protein